MRGVAVHVAADVHGAHDALRKAVAEGSVLVLLGDLVNFIDYTQMSGILTEVFPREDVERVVELRTAGRVLEARDVMRRRAAGRESEIRAAIGERAAAQYEAVVSALPEATHLVPGNVDNPAVLAELAARAPHVQLPDGRVVEIEGERFAFVGGALPTPLGVAGEVSEEEMAAKVAALGDADVICSHIPPAVPELCFDTRAGKSERGSPDILRYIEDVQPRRAYFGHVHQPLVSALHIGRTLCVNVGYFRATGRTFPHSR